jgi:O-antigen ligase
VTYHPSVNLFLPAQPVDAASAVLYVAVFLGVAWIASRRAAYGLCALVLVAPFAFYREFAGTEITFPKVALLGVLLGLTGYPGSLRYLRERPAALLAAALAAYLVATLLSIVHAGDRGAVLREALKVAEYIGFFAAAYLCYRFDPDDALLAGAFAAATLVVCACALAQEIGGAPSVLCFGTAIVPRIAGALEGPNQLAGYLEVSAAALGAWSLARRSALIDVALALAACTAVLTFSRAGIAALLLVFAVLAFAARRRALRALVPGAAGLVAGALAAGAWALRVHDANVLRISLGASACTGGVGSRAELWPAAWRMFLRHPFLGVGAGNYQLDLPLYGVMGVRTLANSWYLQSLAEGGLVLLGATVALVGTMLFVLRSRTPWALAGFAATAALALHQIVDDLVFYPKVAAAWMILVGIGAAALSRRT